MTYVSFLAELRGLDIAGVKRKFDAPPPQISGAMLPMMYPLLPEGNSEIVAFNGDSGVLSCACDLAIVVGVLGQSNNVPNMDATVLIMDALHTALDAAATAGRIDRWVMRMDTNQIGETSYWRIITRVEASE